MNDAEDDPEGPRRAITPPERSISAGVSRRVAKGALGAVPIAGSVLSEIADALLPDPLEIERGQWESDISHDVNAAHKRLDGIESGGAFSETIGGLAAQVSKLLIEHCPDGRHRQWVDVPDLAEQLGTDTAAVLGAAGELKMFGLVESRTLVNAPHRVRLTEGAYAQLDNQIMGWNTMKDARRVASLALEAGEAIRTADLHHHTGWEQRRFNPAFAEVLGLVVDGPISREVQADYPTRSFRLSAADRARLRRFLGRTD